MGTEVNLLNKNTSVTSLRRISAEPEILISSGVRDNPIMAS